MNILRFFSALFFSAFLFVGCQKWNDPQFKEPIWDPDSTYKSNNYWTIDNPNVDNRKNVLWKHRDSSGAWKALPDSITTNTTPRFVKAVVVSSDEDDNYYKSLIIQDATGSVELALDMNSLYNFYPVGQKVVLKLNELVLGDVDGLSQIGWLNQTMQLIPVNSLFIEKYLFKDGVPDPQNFHGIIKILTNNEIDFNKNINQLVRLEKVKFKKEALGKPFAYNDILTTEWIIEVPTDAGTQEVIVRTSHYAKFRNMIIQNSAYNLTGILSFNPNTLTYQLIIRTQDDICQN